tara:strand:+ start:316 stop:543 length:228 start_codon:yes stop_codon:yes gene_type:complete
MEKSLEEALVDGIVLIKFRSLRSGNIYEREYTLSDKYISNKIENQSGDKLICYDIDFDKWEDIEKETIIEWSKIT